MDDDFSISEFGALPRDEVLGLLAQCISRLSPTQKTILALCYHEDLEPAEIAACVGLTEGEFDQVRAETVGLLRTMLAAQIGLPELPGSFDKPQEAQIGLPELPASHEEPQEADGADILVNG
jgi:hypothetical protein